MNQQISLYEMSSRSTLVMNPNIYARNDSRGWVWLQRMCFWMLDKIGAHHYDDKVDYKRIEISLDKVVDAAMRSAHAVQAFENKKPKYLIVGHREAMMLMRDAPIHMMAFTVPQDYRAKVSPKQYERIFAGMRVVVVPWIDGLFVLPEIE